MTWKEESTMSLKEKFMMEAVNQEASMSELCRRYQISRKTGYYWLKRYEEEGKPGLLPRSKRPISSPDRTDKKIELAIIALREEEPTWGARKIIRYLSNEGMKHLPSARTVTNILKRYGFVSIEESLKRQKLIRFEREKSNDLWQMDFKGRFQLLTRDIRGVIPSYYHTQN